MSKYQESLDSLVEYFNTRGVDYDRVDDIQTSLDDLQQLIDESDKQIFTATPLKVDESTNY